MILDLPSLVDPQGGSGQNRRRWRLDLTTRRRQVRGGLRLKRESGGRRACTARAGSSRRLRAVVSADVAASAPGGSEPAPAATASGPLLQVRDVALRFGGIVALDGVSFDLEAGQILGLIGPNGAGKTTLFNCISRLYTPNRGDILFEGRSMLARSPHNIAEIGIGRTFQNLALFGPQSVLDNVRIGGHAHSRSDFASDTLR